MNTPTTSQDIVSDRVRAFLRTEGHTREWFCEQVRSATDPPTKFSTTTLWRRLNGHEAWVLPELEIVAALLGVGVIDLLSERAA